jgi:hypothetical protein
MVDLNTVRAAWTRRYGEADCRRMMARAGMAGDAMPSGLRRRARDADLIPTERRDVRREEDGDFGRDQDDGLDQVKAFLRNRLSTEDFARLEAMMDQLAGGGEEGEEDAGSNHREDPMPSKPPPNGTQDEPPNFQGAPLKGGKKFGQDSRGDSYHDVFGNRDVAVWER